MRLREIISELEERADIAIERIEWTIEGSKGQTEVIEELNKDLDALRSFKRALELLP